MATVAQVRSEVGQGSKEPHIRPSLKGVRQSSAAGVTVASLNRRKRECRGELEARLRLISKLPTASAKRAGSSLARQERQ